MNLIRWITGRFSLRGRSMSIYKRGMAKARRHDHQGAIEDYSTSIGMADTPVDVRAMALFNRALVYSTIGDEPKGTADLQMILAMDEVLVNVKTMARQKLVRMEHQRLRNSGRR